MKTIIAVMVLTASALAQGPSVRVASACGPKNVSFDVKLDDSRHTAALPEPGRAMVYFIQDDGPWGKYQHYVLKIGVDGEWVGAYKKNSYFTVDLMPGDHHVCAAVQSTYPLRNYLALAHFTAEPGKTYYFHTQFFNGTSSLYPSPPYVQLDLLDSDEGKYMISIYPLSVWSAKK